MLDGPAQCPTLNAITQVHFFVRMLAFESGKKRNIFKKSHFRMLDFASKEHIFLWNSGEASSDDYQVPL